jgi:hypothetical protein
MACTVFRGSYWELPLRPVGSVISLTDDNEVISYIQENNGLITIHYESALFYVSCNSKWMLRKASAILLLCPEFERTMILWFTFLCRQQLTEFIWGTNSRNNHYGFSVVKKTRTITYFINVFTTYADLPMYLRIPHYIPNHFCYTICSHVQAHLLWQWWRVLFYVDAERHYIWTLRWIRSRDQPTKGCPLPYEM